MLWTSLYLARRQGEGHTGDVPQGGGGGRRGRNRNLGRRRADAIVHIYRRLRGGNAAADTLRLRRAGEYRLRGDGDDQSARGSHLRSCGQARGEASRQGAARGARTEFR